MASRAVAAEGKLNVASAIGQNSLTILGAGDELPDNAAGAEFYLTHELESK